MDPEERQVIVDIFKDAQGVVEEALGASLSVSVARDQLLVNLSVLLLQEYWDRKYMARRQPREEKLFEKVDVLARDVLFAWQKDKHSGHIDPQETAMALTREMAAQWPERAREREWMMDTFFYFLERARQVLAPPGPEATSGA